MITEHSYAQEDDLQKIISDNPDLLLRPMEPGSNSLYLVKRELTISEGAYSSNACFLDVLLVDRTGIPDTLRQLIDFMNRNMPSIEVYGGEIRQFILDNTTVLTSTAVGSGSKYMITSTHSIDLELLTDEANLSHFMDVIAQLRDSIEKHHDSGPTCPSALSAPFGRLSTGWQPIRICRTGTAVSWMPSTP